MPWVFDDATTVSEALRRGLRESNNGQMLGVRKKQPDGSAPYVWVTYKEVFLFKKFMKSFHENNTVNC